MKSKLELFSTPRTSLLRIFKANAELGVKWAIAVSRILRRPGLQIGNFGLRSGAQC